LTIDSLKIRAGEKVALVGRVSAGKSSMLRVLAGLLPPGKGVLTLDYPDYGAIRVDDLRRHIGYMLQESRLFYGTLRENLAMGHERATDEEMLRALHLAGAEQLAAGGTRSLDIPVFEGGQGLSSGQRQFVLLARTLIGKPQILMLDEPTSSMDDAAETLAVTRLKEWLGGRTLVLVTHRMAALALVDGGRIVMDGPREEILARLAGKPAAHPAGTPAGYSMHMRDPAARPVTRTVPLLRQPHTGATPAHPSPSE
jgi:ATP-binding cassette subfamily C protein LapB